MKPDYMIYPTLLDKFQDLLDADILAEMPWNFDGEGSQKLAPDELASELENDLLDAVNRVPKETSEAAARGTAFNAIVDSIINSASGFDAHETEGMKLEHDCEGRLWRASFQGFDFAFAHSLCAEAADRIGLNAVQQFPCGAFLETDKGLVWLYGYADEVLPDRVIDIKTTSSYTFGNYERKWQKLVYPYCLVQSGDMPGVRSLEYLVVQLYRPTLSRPFIDGELYSEEYTYGHDYAADRLRGMCSAFIGWLEANRDRITDTRIFGRSRRCTL